MDTDDTRRTPWWRIPAVALTVAGSFYLAGHHLEQAPLPESRAAHSSPIERNAPAASFSSSAHAQSLPHAASSLEDILSAPNSDARIDPVNAHKLLTSLAHLSSHDLEGYEAAARTMRIDPALLTTISVLESEGARTLAPRAYVSDASDPGVLPDHIPFGHHHVKPRDLASVLDQASAASAYFEGLLEERWNEVQTEGWGVLDRYDEILTEDERERARAAFGSRSGALRSLGLASLVSSDKDLDLTDAHESALASSIMNAYTASYFASHSIPIDERALLLAYTAGPIGAARALPSNHPDLTDEGFASHAREASGEYGAWYVETGMRILDELRTYGSLFEAREHALDVTRIAGASPEATDEMIGTLYMLGPASLEALEIALAPSNEGRANFNETIAAYANR